MDEPGPVEPEYPGQVPDIPPYLVLSAQTNATNATRVYQVTASSEDGDTLLAIVAGNNASSQIVTSALTDARGNVYRREHETNAQPHAATFRADGATGGPGGGPTVGLAVGDNVTVSGLNGNAQWQCGLTLVAVPAGPLVESAWTVDSAATIEATVPSPGEAEGGVFITLMVNQAAGGTPLYDPPFDRLFAATAGHMHSCAYLLAQGRPTGDTTCTAHLVSASARMCLWSFHPPPREPEPEPGEPLEILTRELAPGEVGEPYDQGLEAAGGTLPHGWAAAPLPAGLGLAGSRISGAPEEAGTTPVRLEVTDAEGDSEAVTLPLVVTAAPVVPPEPEPEPVEPMLLVPVRWGALELNPGDRGDGTTVIVTDVEGWYGTPAMDGRNVERALSDGALFGPKTTGARLVTITGAAAGPRPQLLALSRQLAAAAAMREPVELAIGETDAEEAAPVLVAQVRADSDAMAHAWRGRELFTYQVALTAADPRLYEADWRAVELTFGAEDEGTGRDYPLGPPRRYNATSLPNSARLPNPGNVTAPVWIVYAGPLAETRLSDGSRSIRLAALGEGQQVLVESSSLVAIAPGGATRASYVLAGSAPLVLPPRTGASWSLYGSGSGSARLRWRGAWV